MSQSTPWLIITAHLVQPVVGILVDIDPIECPYQQFSLPFGKATHPVGRQTAISRRIGRYFMRTGIYSVQAVGQETDPDVMGSIFIDSYVIFVSHTKTPPDDVPIHILPALSSIKTVTCPLKLSANSTFLKRSSSGI